MERRKFLSRWILISGILISIISLLHNAFAPAMYQQMMDDISVRDKAAGLIYFFVLGGTAFLFAGFLTIYSSIALKRSERWAWVIALSSGLFVAIGQISAVLIARFGNPLIYAAGICSISNVIILLIFKNTFKVTEQPENVLSN